MPDRPAVAGTRQEKLKQTLPLYKEVGEVAAAFLQQHGAVGELYLTQWPSVLPSTTASADMMARTRRIAAMAEKGDPANWNELVGDSTSYNFVLAD